MSTRLPAIHEILLAAVFWGPAQVAWAQSATPAAVAPAGGYFVEASQETDEGAVVFYACAGGSTAEGEWRGHIRLTAFGVDARVTPAKPAYPVWQEKATVTVSGDVQFTVPREAGAFEGSGRLETRISGDTGFVSAVIRIPLRRADDRHLDLHMVPGAKSGPIHMEIQASNEQCPAEGLLRLSSRERRSAREVAALPVAAQDAFRQAFRDFSEGRLDRAKASFEELARQYPRNATLRFNLATAAAMTGDPARAIECCRGALELDQNQPDVHNTLGLALFRAGRPDEGLASLEQAVRVDPTYFNGWYQLAAAYELQGAAERAAEARHRLEAQVPREDREIGLLVQSLNLSSLRAQHAGRPEEARAGLERALRWDPYSPITLRNQGALAFFRGDVDEAVRLLTLSRQIEPDHARTWYNLGHAHRAKGDAENALACYRRYVELERDPAEQSRVENAKALIQQLTR